MTRAPQDLRLDDYGYSFAPDTRQHWRKTAIKASRAFLGKCIYLLMSCTGFFLWLGRRFKRYPALTPSTFHPRRILVIRLDLIGDLVLSMVIVRALKRTYPEAEIDLVAVAASASVVRNDPDLAQIIPYDPNIWRRPKALITPRYWRELRSLLKTLHARQYDLAISVFGNWAGTLAVLSGATRRVGFGRENFPGFMTDSVAGKHWQPGERKHEVDYCLALAQRAGAQIRAEDRIPCLYADKQAQKEVEALLLSEGVPPGKTLIACHVSSNNGQSKRWPIPYWVTLIERLVGEDGYAVVLTGAPNDLPLIERILSHTHESPINLAGRTSLSQLAELLRRADLMITGDSGPMHIATAVGTPLIAIHGPTDPAQSGPVSPCATILKSGIWCSPCYTAKDTADCRFFTTQCMKNILPAQVLTVAREKLREAQQEHTSQ